MAEGRSRPIALALAVLDSSTSDSALVPGEPEPDRVPVTITFDSDGGALGQSERQAAYELNSAIEVLNTSRTVQGLLAENELESLTINVGGTANLGTNFGGAGFVNINLVEIATTMYQGTNGVPQQMTLDHALVHEVVHAITGLNDGPIHNSITNEILAETGMGVPRTSYEDAWSTEECFVAGTPILLATGQTVNIEDVVANMQVAAFDAREMGGRAELHAKEVVRVYHGVTQELIRLDFDDNRPPVHVTPGHAFLDETGSFTKIGDLVRLRGGTARLIDQSGEVETVSATWLHFSAETADLFERSQTKSVTVSGNTVLKERVEEGWKTYNFEVAQHHTYVAGGIRVHNESGFLGQLGNTLDNGFFDQLGVVGDSIGDLVNGAFHAAGELVGGVVRAGHALSDGFSAAGDRFRDGDVLGGIGEIGRGIGNAIGEVARGIGNAIGEVARGIGNAIGSVFGRNDDNDGAGNDRGKPIILDMDGDGVEIAVHGEVAFDMDGDGYLEETNWVHADDAFLVLDLNADGTRGAGDGVIDQTAEVVLSKWLDWEGTTDLQALATFDQSADRGGNDDGVLDHRDSVWSELRVWQDTNYNGETDAGELRTLSEVGISQIGLTYDDGTHYSDLSNDQTLFNSSLLGSASYVRNGETVTGGVGDVALSYGAVGWKTVETSYGFRLDFEDGSASAYVDVEGKSFANANLASGGYSGAFGDGRANSFDATGITHTVILEGYGGNDTLIGGAGDDMIEGGAGADTINGGAGNDTVSYASADAGILLKLFDGTASGGHAQGDVLSNLENVIGSAFNDTINGNGTGNLLRGEGGNDKVYGLGGWDEIWLGDGDDVATGGAGNDAIYGEDGNDNIFGNDGKDTLYGGAGNDRLFGHKHDDQLFGGAGNDLMRGGGYKDILDGGSGNDTLYGDTGADRLIGGADNDTLTGGTHGNYQDVFVFGVDDGDDIITDFENGEDRIEFTVDGLSYADLGIVSVSGGVRITYDPDDTISLNGVTIGQIDPGDFIFV